MDKKYWEHWIKINPDNIIDSTPNKIAKELKFEVNFFDDEFSLYSGGKDLGLREGICVMYICTDRKSSLFERVLMELFLTKKKGISEKGAEMLLEIYRKYNGRLEVHDNMVRIEKKVIDKMAKKGFEYDNSAYIGSCYDLEKKIIQLRAEEASIKKEIEKRKDSLF